MAAKPFVKWVGGKGQLRSAIEGYLPRDLAKIPDLTYIEPFIGGGATLFYMLQNYPNIKKAVINDINRDLVVAYRMIKEKPDEIVGLLKKIQDEYRLLGSEEERKEYYLTQREIFNGKDLPDLLNTALFIFLNKTCFNGMYRVNSKGLFNVPFGRYVNPAICDEKTIYADSELLQKVEIICGDFSDTECFATKNTFFYFDPPYRPLNATSSFNSYAKEVFNDEEQIRLKHYCDHLTGKGYKIMLSNSDGAANDPKDCFFNDLYRGYRIGQVWANRFINSKADKRGKLTELLIRNYRKKFHE